MLAFSIMGWLKQINNRGQLIAEVIIAVGVISLVLVSVSSLMSQTTKTYRLQKEKDEAVRLIETKLRYYRGQRDANTASFFSSIVLGDSSCMPWGVTTTGSFTCSVNFSNVSNGVKIVVTATWPTNNSTSLSTILTNR